MHNTPSRSLMGRTLIEWFSSLPVFIMLMLTLIIGTGEMVHGQLLKFGESMFGNPATQVQYFMLRAEPVKPECIASLAPVKRAAAGIRGSGNGHASMQRPFALGQQGTLTLLLDAQALRVRTQAWCRTRGQQHRDRGQPSRAHQHAFARRATHDARRLMVSISTLLSASFLRPCSQIWRAPSRSPLTQSTSPRCAATSLSGCLA